MNLLQYYKQTEPWLCNYSKAIQAPMPASIAPYWRHVQEAYTYSFHIINQTVSQT